MLFTLDSPDLNECPVCWDEEYWTSMTEEDWTEVFNQSFFESAGGD